MNVIEFPSQTGARLTARSSWRVQPQPIRIRPPQRETLAEFLGIINDPEFQKSVGRILAAEAFGENPDVQFAVEPDHPTKVGSSIAAAAFGRSSFDEAGRVFDFLLESARLDRRDRQAANQQREYQRRMFARHVSGDAVTAMRQLMAQGNAEQTETSTLPVDSVSAFRRRRRTLRQVSRGVDPQVAAERASRDDDYRKWVLSTNTGVKSANEAEALLRVGLVKYKEYSSHLLP